MCFDASVELVVDRSNGQIVLELLEGLLDFGELDVKRPQRRRCGFGEVRAQQVSTLALTSLSKLRTIDAELEAIGHARLITRRRHDVQ